MLRVMVDQAITGEGERSNHEMYAEGSAPELASRLVSQWDELARNIAAEEVGAPKAESGPEPAGDFKRPPHRSLIDEAIASKGPNYSAAQTFRSDAMAILEALVAEGDEGAVAAALKRQGFKESGSYLTTLRALTSVAASRRRPG